MLQVDWLMARLRPMSVSSGSTEMQFDCTEQSPQPSQTAGLMTRRRGGSSSVPRLRRRRFSAAQVCTNTIAEAPLVSRRVFMHRVEIVAMRGLDARRNARSRG